VVIPAIFQSNEAVPRRMEYFRSFSDPCRLPGAPWAIHLHSLNETQTLGFLCTREMYLEKSNVAPNADWKMQMTIPKSSTQRLAASDRALERLAGAVLIQAVRDASSGPKRCRGEALDWIWGQTTGSLSFEFCCSLLRRRPDDVRRRLQGYVFAPRWAASCGGSV
jgi:hypothetical protein